MIRTRFVILPLECVVFLLTRHRKYTLTAPICNASNPELRVIFLRALFSGSHRYGTLYLYFSGCHVDNCTIHKFRTFLRREVSCAARSEDMEIVATRSLSLDPRSLQPHPGGGFQTRGSFVRYPDLSGLV